MDIYNYLKKDHKEVNKLMEDVLDAPDNKKRLELFDKLKHDLLLHAKTEQDTFYKELEDKKPAKERIEREMKKLGLI